LSCQFLRLARERVLEMLHALERVCVVGGEILELHSYGCREERKNSRSRHYASWSGWTASARRTFTSHEKYEI